METMIKAKMLTSIVLRRTDRAVRYGEIVELTKGEFERLSKYRMCELAEVQKAKKEAPKKEAEKKEAPKKKAPRKKKTVEEV